LVNGRPKGYAREYKKKEVILKTGQPLL